MNEMTRIDAPALIRARSLMQEALTILDKSCASPEIGAHLDLAICRIEGALDITVQLASECGDVAV